MRLLTWLLSFFAGASREPSEWDDLSDEDRAYLRWWPKN